MTEKPNEAERWDLIPSANKQAPTRESLKRMKEAAETALQRKEEAASKTMEKLPAIYEASTGQIAAWELRQLAVRFAERIALKAELGHVVLYYGKPWVTIDGWYYRFRQLYPQGVVLSRPLTREEREDAKVEYDTHAWKAEAYAVPGGGLLGVGYGYSRAEETVEEMEVNPETGEISTKTVTRVSPLARKSSVEPNWPWRMAEKRAEEDCLRKAVPLE